MTLPNVKTSTMEEDAAAMATRAITVLQEVVDQAFGALDTVTEMDLSDGIEAALHRVDETLEALEERLSEAPLEESQAELRSEAARQLALEATDGIASSYLRPPPGEEEDLVLAEVPPPSTPEAAEALLFVKALLGDMRAALADVSREEIEEIADVCLTVARLALSSARRALSEIARGALQIESGVTIEDLGEVGADRSQSQRPADEIVLESQERARPRYLWRPLWPRAREAGRAWLAQPKLPNVPIQAIVREHPAGALAVAVTWPVWIVPAVVASWSAAVVVPSVFLADAGLQHVYEGRRREADDFLEGAFQVTKLGTLSAKLALRRGYRVVRAQFRRAARGRSTFELAKDCVTNPVSAACTAGSLAMGAAREAASLVSNIVSAVREVYPNEASTEA